jgi:hypothetical protein
MPDLDELATLTPPDDLPGDAYVEITVEDLRALVACIPAAKEVASVFGTHLPEAEHGQG